MINGKNKILEALYKNTLKQEKLLIKAIEKNQNLSTEEKELYKSSLPIFKKLYPKESIYIYAKRIQRYKDKRKNSNKSNYKEHFFNYFNEIMDKETREKFEENFEQLYSSFKSLGKKYKFNYTQILINIKKEINNAGEENKIKFMRHFKDKKFEDLYQLRNILENQITNLLIVPNNDESKDYKEIINSKNLISRNFLNVSEPQDKFDFGTTYREELIAEFIANQFNLTSYLGYSEISLSLLKNEDYKNTILLSNKISKELEKHSDIKQINLLVDNFEGSVKKLGLKTNTGYITIDREKLKNYGRKDHIKQMQKELFSKDFIINYEPTKTNPKSRKLFDDIFSNLEADAIKEIMDFNNTSAENSNYHESHKQMTEYNCKRFYANDINDYAKSAFYHLVNDTEDKRFRPILNVTNRTIYKKYKTMINDFADENPDINLAKEFTNYEFELNPNPSTTKYLSDKKTTKYFHDMNANDIVSEIKKPKSFIKHLTSDIESITSNDKNKINHRRILSKIDTNEFNQTISSRKDVSWKLAFEAYNIFQNAQSDIRFFNKVENHKLLTQAKRKLELASKLAHNEILTEENIAEIHGNDENIKRIFEDKKSKSKPKAIQLKIFSSAYEACR
jgi:hypothetical protein